MLCLHLRVQGRWNQRRQLVEEQRTEAPYWPHSMHLNVCASPTAPSKLMRMKATGGRGRAGGRGRMAKSGVSWGARLHRRRPPGEVGAPWEPHCKQGSPACNGIASGRATGKEVAALALSPYPHSPTHCRSCPRPACPPVRPPHPFRSSRSRRPDPPSSQRPDPVPHPTPGTPW